MRLLARSTAAAAIALLWAAGGAPSQEARPGPDDPGTGTTVAESIPATNPTPYSEAARKNGRTQYLRHCQICHGFDGRALENIDFEATDLTDPRRWRFGTTDGDLFRSTKFGAGLDMPPFEAELDDQQIWDLVHYLRSIGPKAFRPAEAGTEDPAENRENRR